MNKLLTPGKKALFATFTAAIVVACQLKNAPQTNSNISSAPIPSKTSLRMLEARVSGNTVGIRGFLVSSTPSNEVQPMSDSFFIRATNETQLIGTMTASSQLPAHYQVVTNNGKLTSCNNTSGTNAFTIQVHSSSIQCGAQTFLIELSSAPEDIKALDEKRSRLAIAHGALFNLSSTKETIEAQIENDFLKVFQNGKVIQFKLKSAGISELIDAETKITFTGDAQVCPNRTCNSPTHSAELTASADQIQLRLRDSNSQSESLYSTQFSNKLSLASYNVENFWDDDPNNSSPYNDYSSLYSNWYIGNYAKKKAERIKTALLAAGLPDVVGLQEIESASNKSRSLELLKPVLSELGYNYYALGLQAENNPTAVTTAVVSKYPIIENKRIDFVFAPETLPEDQRRDFIGSSRDPQHVTITTPEGTSFALINSHWKSKRDKSPFGDDMRMAVAQLIKKYSDSISFDNGTPAPVVIVGDFNSDYRESPVYSGLELAETLNSARLQGHSKQLVPLWLTLGAHEQGSYPHDSHLQALDNIIVTASFLKGQGVAVSTPMWVAGRTGLSALTLANADGQPLRSQIVKYKDSQGDIHTKHFDLGFSDHFPLVVQFERNSKGPAQTLPQAIEEQNSKNLESVLISGFECSASQTVSLAPEMLAEAHYGQCISMDGMEMPLNKTGLYNIYISSKASNLTEKPAKVIITADRAYGTNKAWLRGTLQNSHGRTLTKIKGRIGLVEGQKAIFIHSPVDDIEIK